MAWGIFEPWSGQHVRGTVLLNEDSIVETRSSGVETTKRGSATIILVPQPSDDPNDPLNWRLWVRDLISLLCGYCALLIVGG